MARYLSFLLAALACAAAINTLSPVFAAARGEVRRSQTEEEAAKALAEYVADLSAKTVKERKKFTVAVAGGTLIHTMRKLLEEPYLHSVDWSAWHMFWVDERAVPNSSTDSNYNLARVGFLSKVPIPAGSIHPVNTELAYDAAAADYEALIKKLMEDSTVASSPAGLPKFDLILMGAGLDCHIASLFPGSPLLQEKQKWVAGVEKAIIAPRVTFSLPPINSAANLAFVITASDLPDWSHANLSACVKKGIEGGHDLPIQMVSPEGGFLWFLDSATSLEL
ncbi:probable 6-phosphogluconolactonase 4, chloroplastic [Diospyros lotus]|uniref:probable 6-phosphogluconolactonase 4, chloroplastic n=1 Tax=Diospyros lotus TaxID=55363 RepID=UPI002257AB7E|nr:probable 6-phosphogluconolactonase 4, chloroplastic [Diospyros lotus]